MAKQGGSRVRDRPSQAHVVATVEEIPPGGRKIVTIDGRSIGVFNVRGTYYALRNVCPHQQAALCEGRIMGTTLPSKPGEYRLGYEGQIIRCPWHAWEFDLATGRSVFDPKRCRVRSYEVSVNEALEEEEKVLYAETFPTSVDGPYVLVHV